MLCLVGEDGMEWIKTNENRRGRSEVLKKNEWVQNCYDEIWEEIEYRREWSILSQTDGVVSSIGCKEWNGGRNGIYKQLTKT